MSMNGEQVVVIGGSSGIGLAVARMARAEGAVVTIASRSAERLADAQRTLAQDEGVPPRTAVVDVADEASIAALFEGMPRVDHVLISAGTLGNGAIVKNDLETLRSIVDVRLWGVVHAVRHAAPKMTDGGSLTLMSGGISSRPRVGAAMFTSILSGVEALAPALALELAPVRVNCVTPGLVDTPLSNTGPDARARLDARAAALPGKRIGQPEDIAQVILMLMQNAYITGEVIHVDGGGRFI